MSGEKRGRKRRSISRDGFPLELRGTSSFETRRDHRAPRGVLEYRGFSAAGRIRRSGGFFYFFLRPPSFIWTRRREAGAATFAVEGFVYPFLRLAEFGAGARVNSEFPVVARSTGEGDIFVVFDWF